MYNDDEDFEIIYSEDLDQIVDVHEDSVTVRLPDCLPLFITDSELDTLFMHPEILNDIVDKENYAMLAEIFTHVFRVRALKRELYKELGF